MVRSSFTVGEHFADIYAAFDDFGTISFKCRFFLGLWMLKISISAHHHLSGILSEIVSNLPASQIFMHNGMSVFCPFVYLLLSIIFIGAAGFSGSFS